MNSDRQPPQTDSRSRSSISQTGGRRPYARQGVAPFHAPSALEKDGAKGDSTGLGLGQRSVSLNTLQPTVIQPRMAQLETLEAKMASIEVSLSSTPRRKKNGSLSGISIGSSIRSIPKEMAVKELETLRNALKDKENIIQSLKGQLTVPGLRLNAIKNNCSGSGNNKNSTNVRELTEVERKHAEDRLSRLKIDVDNKRMAIKNLKMALERLDITDNIDVRIQQAELEYQLGREELNLLTLLEETRALQLCIEESNKNASDSFTLFSCVEGKNYVILKAIEVDFDLKSPKFGAGHKDSDPGLWVDWALEETGLCKGDRIIEVNGKIVLNKNRDDLLRLLAVTPDPAQIVVLRKIQQNVLSSSPSNHHQTQETSALRSELEIIKDRAEEAKKAKEGLRTDNIRLTHRISYLEEQVSELLGRKSAETDIRVLTTPTPVISTVKSNQNVTNINITTQSPTGSSHNSEMQMFQKGSQLTPRKESPVTLPPYRSKSSLSNVSNTLIQSPSQNGDHNCHKSPHRHKHRSSRSGLQSSLSNQVENSDKITYRKHNHHHHHHREKDYSSETNSMAGHVTRYNRKNHENHRYSADFAKANSESEYSKDIMDQSFKKATKIVHELTKSRDVTMYEKHRQKCLTASEKYNTDILKHYNARKSTSVLDFRSEIHIGPRYDSKSVEDLEAAESTRCFPRIPVKVQDSRSVKSLDFDSDCNSTSASCKPNGYAKHTDYTSEPNGDSRRQPYGVHENHVKPRPIPPKKPLRLSLHKTHSLQSVETNDNVNGERKSIKRNYKGEIPIINVKSNNHVDEMSHVNRGHQQIKWNYRRSLENNLENGSWC